MHLIPERVELVPALVEHGSQVVVYLGRGARVAVVFVQVSLVNTFKHICDRLKITNFA